MRANLIDSNNSKPDLLSAANSNHSSPDWDDDETDAYDVQDRRPQSVSLSSQLLCLRELVHPKAREATSPPSIRNSLQDRVFSVELPRPSRLDYLLDIYFRDLDSFFPFIERDGTQAKIHTTLHRLGHSDSQHIIDVKFEDCFIIALLCNMLAVAECFCVSGCPSHEIRRGWSLYLRGRKLMQQCSSLKHIDVYLIQYHALSSEYLMQSELLHDASQAISIAAQLAMRARLNEERVWDVLPEAEICNRKRLWWTIYFLDRKISQRTGIPYLIRDIEVAVSDFSQSLTTATDRYMQVLVDLGKLWSLIWDTFFAATAPKPIDWKEVEVMDTRILVVQRDLSDELAWETELLDRVYLAEREPEPLIRRRFAIYIVRLSFLGLQEMKLIRSQRLNLLRLTIRQNPIQKRKDTRCNSLCISLAAETVDAIAAFTDSCPSIIPCGFFFSTALLECIYHLILAMRATPTHEQREVSIRSFQLAYQLLEQFSKSLDTAKRALRALNSVVSIASVPHSPPTIDGPNPDPEPEQNRTMDLAFQTTPAIDFFDPMSWHIDDIPLDVVALVSSMGNQGPDGAVANGLSHGSLDSESSIWNTDYGIDPGTIHP